MEDDGRAEEAPGQRGRQQAAAGAREEAAGEPARRRLLDAAASRSRTSPGSPVMRSAHQPICTNSG